MPNYYLQVCLKSCFLVASENVTLKESELTVAIVKGFLDVRVRCLSI